MATKWTQEEKYPSMATFTSCPISCWYLNKEKTFIKRFCKVCRIAEQMPICPRRMLQPYCSSSHAVSWLRKLPASQEARAPPQPFMTERAYTVWSSARPANWPSNQAAATCMKDESGDQDLSGVELMASFSFLLNKVSSSGIRQRCIW